MLLHVLAHVDVNESFGISEQAFGKRLGEQCLANSGWTGKHKATRRALWIFQSASAPANGFGNSRNRLLLANDAFVQLGFHVHQPHRIFG